MVSEKVKTGMYWIFDIGVANPAYLTVKCGNKDWRLYKVSTKQVLDRKFKTLRAVRRAIHYRDFGYYSKWIDIEDLPKNYDVEELRARKERLSSIRKR